MDIKKVGTAITYLRKRAGFTQKDLADRLGISDKAVSKWERGLGLPDIAYLGKLSILLDTDTDSLLLGDIIHHDADWNGLLLLSENAEGVGAFSVVYDKPLVYFLLSYFLLVGIKTIYISCPKKDEEYLKSEFGDGRSLNISLIYCSDDEKALRDNIRKADCGSFMTVYGRSFIYGVDQTRFFQRAMVHKDRITVLSLPKKIGESAATVVCFDENMQIVDSKSEEKVYTQYDYHTIPVCFCPKESLEKMIITDNNQRPAVSLSACFDMPVYTEVLDRGFVEMPLECADDICDAAVLVRMIQKACGMNLYCIEEIAWRRGMISRVDFLEYAETKYRGTAYGRYIKSICERYDENTL